MHDGMLRDPIPGQGQGHEPFKVVNPFILKRYLLRHFQREMATDHGFLKRAQYLNLLQPHFWILILGIEFVSHDFEVDRNVSCEE